MYLVIPSTRVSVCSLKISSRLLFSFIRADDDDFDINALNFGDDFNIPMSGLPEFLSDGANSEEMDLASITGSHGYPILGSFNSNSSAWMQNLKSSSKVPGSEKLDDSSVLSSILSLGLEEEGLDLEPSVQQQQEPLPRVSAAPSTIPQSRSLPVAVPSSSVTALTAEQIEAQMMNQAQAQVRRPVVVVAPNHQAVSPPPRVVVTAPARPAVQMVLPAKAQEPHASPVQIFDPAGELIIPPATWSLGQPVPPGFRVFFHGKDVTPPLGAMQAPVSPVPGVSVGSPAPPTSAPTASQLQTSTDKKPVLYSRAVSASAALAPSTAPAPANAPANAPASTPAASYLPPNVSILKRQVPDSSPVTHKSTMSIADFLPGQDGQLVASNQPKRVYDNRNSSTTQAALRLRTVSNFAPGLAALQAPGMSVSSLLSKKLPLNVRGQFMTFAEIMQVARGMQFPLATAGDPFSECYYLFALQAKARAALLAAKRRQLALSLGATQTPGAATDSGAASASHATSGNVFDVAAVLSSFAGASSGPRGPSSDLSGGEKRGNSTENASDAAATSAPTSEESVNVAAAAAALDSVPISSALERSKAAAASELRRVALEKRLEWMQSNKVLGRIGMNNIRTPKQILDLASTSKGSLTTPSSSSTASSSSGESIDENSFGFQDPIWFSRQAVNSVLEQVLSLQDVARRLAAYLKLTPPPPQDILSSLRSEVAALREALAKKLGVRAQAPEPALLLTLLALPKGKRALARAVPMLAPADKVSAVTQCLAQLPHVVASTIVGQDATDADELLTRILAQWTLLHPLSLLPVSSSLPSSKYPSSLSIYTEWVETLHTSHSGALIRALLGHPGASEVISNILRAGEEAAAALESMDAGSVPAAEKESIQHQINAWRIHTEKLGKNFVESA
jgi:Topoisomerase II-associated protein PAT1